MLIKFSVENWQSFREEATLSMLASKERQHRERVAKIDKGKLNLLPIAAIYGGFYGLRVKKFGTIYNDIRKKMMPVDQKISYQLINGSYTMVRQVGENYILSTP